MDEQRQEDQLEPVYNSSVAIQEVALKTFKEQWTIETDGERWSGESVLVVRHDDDNDDDDSIIDLFRLWKLVWWITKRYNVNCIAGVSQKIEKSNQTPI